MFSKLKAKLKLSTQTSNEKPGIFKFKESLLAKRYCRGLGLEIGGSAHNAFGLNTLNVDYTKELTLFKKEALLGLWGDFSSSKNGVEV